MNETKIKSKSIIVTEVVHNDFKKLCKNKNLKIGALIEDLIKLYLSNPKIIQKLIDDLKESRPNNK